MEGESDGGGGSRERRDGSCSKKRVGRGQKLF